MQAQTVTIMGMDRIGVSIAKAIKASPAGLTVIGYDRYRDHVERVKDEYGVIDKAEWNLAKAVAAADILVISVSLAELHSSLQTIGAELQPHALVFDLSSLKTLGQKWADQYLSESHYIGVIPVLAAPYLNDGRSGPEAGMADLFKNSIFCLMPSPDASPQAVDTAVAFGQLLGATPYFIDPMEYDSLAQGIETLPGLTAAAIFSVLKKSTGWRDMLRFANSSFALSTQPLNHGTDITSLALHDEPATLRWLDALIEELGDLRRLILEGDRELIDLTFGQLLIQREQWLKERTRNEWTDEVERVGSHPSLSDQFLGGWLSGKIGKDKRER